MSRRANGSEPTLPNKRGALTQKFIADLEAQWRVYGPEILDKVREEVTDQVCRDLCTIDSGTNRPHRRGLVRPEADFIAG